jgi:hypothetical protein
MCKPLAAILCATVVLCSVRSASAEYPTIDVGGCRMVVGQGLADRMKREGGRATWDGACDKKGLVEGTGTFRRYDQSGRLVHISRGPYKAGEPRGSDGSFDLLDGGKLVSSGLPVSAAALPAWARELVPAGSATGSSRKPGMKLLTLRQTIEGDPKRASALRNVFTGLEHPAWLQKYDYSGQGDSGDVIAIGPDAYEYFEQCEPHNCGPNQMLVLFAPDGSRAWAATVSNHLVSFYGNPQGPIREFLDKRARQAIAGSAVITIPAPAGR